MSGVIVLFLAAFVIFIIFWFVLSRRKQQEDKPVTYTCEECGEKNCNCYRENETQNK